eukprot:2436205-Prymnesium_polylepis.1
MGLPASGVTGMYRNPQSEVIRFLETFHGGQYKIYNLCTRKQDQYDPDAFGGSVVRAVPPPPPSPLHPVVTWRRPCACRPLAAVPGRTFRPR